VNTVAKVAIGCVVSIVGISVVAVVGIGAFGYWATGKVKQAAHDIVGDPKKTAELEEKANANPFIEPADHSITEPRLVDFLAVRKRVYDVYLKHQIEIDAMVHKQGNEGTSLGEIKNGMAYVTEAREARLQGLADLRMSETEYAYYVSAVYTSAVASEVSKATGGKSVSQAVDDAADKEYQKLKDWTPDPNQSAENQKLMRDTMEQMRKQYEEQRRATAGAARAADVPSVNVALFQKHEAEIKKYAMGGLEILGL
jgi:hypothetical protein